MQNDETEQYCPECDEPMEPWTPKPDGSKRWVCDYHGVWSDPPDNREMTAP